MNKECGFYKGPLSGEYMPGFFNPNVPPYFPCNIQLMMRIETNLKLNLINHKDESMLSEKQRNDKEFHFLYIESEILKLEFDFRNPLNFLNAKQPNLEELSGLESFGNWTLIDFDNCLEGNPHVEEQS